MYFDELLWKIDSPKRKEESCLVAEAASIEKLLGPRSGSPCYPAGGLAAVALASLGLVPERQAGPGRKS